MISTYVKQYTKRAPYRPRSSSGRKEVTDGLESWWDVGSWDLSGVRDMKDMFSGCTAFNSDISDWVVSTGT